VLWIVVGTTRHFEIRGKVELRIVNRAKKFPSTVIPGPQSSIAETLKTKGGTNRGPSSRLKLLLKPYLSIENKVTCDVIIIAFLKVSLLKQKKTETREKKHNTIEIYGR
jgi:hypothetical protein